ncbi:MAG: L-threonylcarbamoyladenylate synthase, partial [Alphaproteobacteria bacterium]
MIRTTTDPRTAAEALLSGGLVLLPTETVYGLAARADDPAAVARVYAAKGRPERHPVIVHIADPADAIDPDAPGSWVSDAPEFAQHLAAEFWPGPLTLVLPRSSRATDDITGGQDTVAIRVP